MAARLGSRFSARSVAAARLRAGFRPRRPARRAAMALRRVSVLACPLRGARSLHSRPSSLAKANRDRLLRRPRAVLTLADMMHLLANELPGLGARAFPLALVPPRTLDRPLPASGPSLTFALASDVPMCVRVRKPDARTERGSRGPGGSRCARGGSGSEERSKASPARLRSEVSTAARATPRHGQAGV